MNSILKTVVVGIVFVVFSSPVFGQDAPKAVLVDEMGTRGNNCEELFMRLDNYFAVLANNPTDQAFVIVYQAPQSRSAGRSREYQVKNHTRMRNFEMSRITLVIGGVREDATVQLWRVPPGAENPTILESNAEYEQPEPPERPADEPYIYATEYGDGIPGCSGPAYDLETYAAVLNDKDARGNIVIGQATQAKFRAREREIRAELEQHGVARTRIRTFFKKVKPNSLLEYTELWVLPPKIISMPMRNPTRFTIRGDINIEPPPSTTVERTPDRKVIGDDPAMPPPPPPRPRVPKMISGGVLNGKANSLPRPVYPPAARAVRASGAVSVQVTIDEQGNVISASAVSGHPLLRASAEQAARAAKFSRTLLSGVPVKVTGILIYNFVP